MSTNSPSLKRTLSLRGSKKSDLEVNIEPSVSLDSSTKKTISASADHGGQGPSGPMILKDGDFLAAKKKLYLPEKTKSAIMDQLKLDTEVNSTFLMFYKF
jgi:hypothetical protein